MLRLTYLAVTNAFAVLRLLPMSDRDKDAEILALHRSCGANLALSEPSISSRFHNGSWAFLAALLKPFPRESHVGYI